MRKIVFFWGLLLLLPACGIFKSAPDTKPADKREHKKEDTDRRDRQNEQEETDTLVIVQPSADSSLVQKDTLQIEEDKFRLKRQYDIKILLPLLPLETIAEASEENNEGSGRGLNSWNLSFMEFLAGFKMGLSDFTDTASGFSYRLSIVSTEDMDRDLTGQGDSLSFKNTDVIVGGVTKPSMEKLSAWSAMNQKIYISPWIPYQPLARNTQFIQLSPGIQKHCNALSQYVMREYKLENLFIISSKENDDRIDCFNSYFVNQDINTRFQEILLSDDFDLKELEELSSVFHKLDTNIVIIPESRNKAFIHRVISRLTVLKDYQFKIVGLPGWLKYDLLYNYFEKMPFILSVDQYVSKDSAAYLKFEKAYFDRFHSLPTEWSIKGYDQASFIAMGLFHFGLDLPQNLHSIEFEGVGMDIHFEQKSHEQSSETTLYDNVNNAVQIIEYKQHQFKKVSE